MNRVVFNLAASFLVSILLSVAAGVGLMLWWWPGHGNLAALSNAQALPYLFQSVLLVLPVWIALPAAFAFWKVDDGEVHGVSLFVPVFVFSFLTVGALVLGQFLGADLLTRSKLDSALAMEERALSAKIQEYARLEAWKSRWEKDPASAPELLRQLDAMAAEFPFHLELFRLIDEIRKGETLKRLEQKEARPQAASSNKSMENRAEEARNRRDWVTAELLYRKLIERVPPGRPFDGERKRLEHALKVVLDQQENPASRLTEGEVRDLALREELSAVDALLQEGKLPEAFSRARDLRLRDGKNEEIKSRYERAEHRLRHDEFLAQDYLLRERFLSSDFVLGKTVLRVNGWVVRAEKIRFSGNFVYLEQVQAEQGEKRWSSRYGRVASDRVFLKNGEEKSQILVIPGLSASLEQALFLKPSWRRELWFLSAPAVERYRVFARENLGQNDRFWIFLREAKYFLLPWCFCLCLLFTGLSWWNREHLFDPFHLSTLLFILAIASLVFLAAVYLMSRQYAFFGVTGIRLTLGALCAVFGAASLLFISKVR